LSGRFKFGYSLEGEKFEELEIKYSSDDVIIDLEAYRKMLMRIINALGEVEDVRNNLKIN
jgi:hypothetical protein